MSRLARRPVIVPSSVTYALEGDELSVKGPKAELRSHIPSALVTFQQTGEEVLVQAATEEQASRAASGLVKNIFANMVKGVQEDFVKELRFTGVGYRAEASGNKLTLNVGYSHPVIHEAPAGIAIAVQKNIIRISGADLQAVGQFAANVRATRPPEPYKGKGIAYATEHIRRKAGKAGKAGA